MRKSRANKSERVQKPATKGAPKVDPSVARSTKLKAAVRLVVGGDQRAEPIVVELLRASLAHSDKQDERAEWLGVSPRYLRYVLSTEVGVAGRNADVVGRAKGFNDAGLRHERPDGSGWTEDSPRKAK